MTCIIGIEHGGRVYLAGDAMVRSGELVYAIHEPKVWRTRGMVFGVSGSCRERDIVRHIRPPKAPTRHRRRWLVNVFVASLWPRLVQVVRDRSGDEVELDLLVGIRDRLYSVDCRGAVSSAAHGYDAIGAARGIALGYLTASRVPTRSSGSRER